MLVIDGAYGEGGGQILRTSLSLAAILGRPIRIDNIRAGRENPGLAAQHLVAVRAAARICGATLTGDRLGSMQLTFEPGHPPVPGTYHFNVAEGRTGGSAGAATLVLQTVLLPLALAPGPSTLVVKGGTHVPWSPSFFYLAEVYLPMLALLGVEAVAELNAWGWYPAGGGEISVKLPGRATLKPNPVAGLWVERGDLRAIWGVAVAAELPSHIAQRMRDRATGLLRQAGGLPADIEPQRIHSLSPGAGIFLAAEYELSRAGFSALGRKGKPSEQVAEEAVNDLLAFHESETVLDTHLADQLVLPMALSGQPGTFSVESLSLHTLTNIWVVEQFLGPVAYPDETHNLISFTPRG